MIAALLDKLEVERPLLVGHSLGGAVSLALAEAHPGRVRGLALIAPYTQPIDTPPAPFRSLMVPAWLRPVIAWTLAVPLAILTGPAKTREVFAPDPVPADFGTRGGGLLAVRPRGFEQGSFELTTARDAAAAIAAGYGAVEVPVAILYGRGDALLDPAMHGERTAAAIAGATVTLIDGGHMLPITWPAETEAWLRGL
jgi:pimeloyl-ACP methyl ester carboxylesterase